MSVKDIYKMKLHEMLMDLDNPKGEGQFTCLRVAGGWIYTQWIEGIPQPVFVPFNNEFMESEEVK